MTNYQRKAVAEAIVILERIGGEARDVAHLLGPTCEQRIPDRNAQIVTLHRLAREAAAVRAVLRDAFRKRTRSL